jgi:hypothetical protein
LTDTLRSCREDADGNTTSGAIQVELTFTDTSMWKVQETHGRWWLTPVILATWEAEIRRIKVPGQPQQKKK